jgi:PucR family transcriptional regulator, purine catabolism regulatory protein
MTAVDTAAVGQHRTILGITVGEALALPALTGARLIAGEAGLSRRIRSVNMMEVPDIAEWLREDELLVTTAYPLRGDAQALPDLIRLASQRGLAGIALKPGRYIVRPPGTTLALADQLAFPLIELGADASFNDILADVLGTILNRQAVELERSRAMHQRLTAVVLAGGSLRDVIDTLARLTHSHAAIVDVRGKLLAASGGVSDPAGPAGMTRAVRPIRAGSTDHGTLLLWTPDPRVPPDTLVAMDHAATIAALTLTQAQALAGREQRSRVLLLEELVSGHPVDRDDVLERASSFGWDLNRPRAALRLELRGMDGEEVLVAGHPLEEQLVGIARQALGRESIAWALRSGMAALIDARTAEAADHAGPALRAALTGARPELRAAIAIGRPALEVIDLGRSYAEAVETLTLGQQLYGAEFVATRDQLILHRLLSQLPVAALEQHVSEVLGPVVEFDRRHNAALLETLESYLGHGRNRAATARALYVHYNTLRYRLEQLERLLGELTARPDGWVTIEVAVHARQLLAAQHRIAPARPAPQASARPRAIALPDVRPNPLSAARSPRSRSA